MTANDFLVTMANQLKSEINEYNYGDYLEIEKLHDSLGLIHDYLLEDNVCPCCGGKTYSEVFTPEPKYIETIDGKKPVEVQVCPSCGEMYYF